MPDNNPYAFFAVSRELNKRDFRRKIALIPEDQRFRSVLAHSIVGAENARRASEMPPAVAIDAQEFVEKLLGMTGFHPDDGFAGILETALMDAVREELRHSCANCRRFSTCLDLDNSGVGQMFELQARGEDTETLREKLERTLDAALRHAPHVDSDRAHELCEDFSHQCSVARLGEVFGRYSEIAAELARAFGIDYRKVQQQMIALNMEFVRRAESPLPDSPSEK